MPTPLLMLAATMWLGPSPSKTEVLPLRKLRLYETGVGYFERRGGVKASRALALPLPASHLDDALKTLVILDQSGNARVQGVQFASSVSEAMARSMAGLPEGESQPLGYADVLRSLEGTQIETRSGERRTRGRLVEIEGPFVLPPPEAKDGKQADPSQAKTNAEPYHALVILGEDGELTRVRTDRLDAIKALDSDMNDQLQIAAAALSNGRARRAHPLEIQVSDAGQLGLGYIAETPIWRTTYRVVFAQSGEEGQLQGWALVHNDTEEDWAGIQLELVNGQPTSFLYPLAAPRYAWRDLRGPEEEYSTVPQLISETVDRMWGESFGEGGLGLVGTGRGGGGTGQGAIGLGRHGIVGRRSGSSLALGDLAELSQAAGTESGALFIYAAREPLDLESHHSALLPLIQRKVEAESITWFGTSSSEGLSGVRLVNSTGQTLPAGAISFFADGGFIGESELARLKPKERQFMVYGSELDVDLERNKHHQGDEARKLTFNGRRLEEHIVVRQDVELDVYNRSGRARHVYVALDIPRNAKLSGDVDLDFDLKTGTPLASTKVAAGAKAHHVLHTETAKIVPRPSIDIPLLQRLAKTSTLPDSTRKVLRRAIAQRQAIKATTKSVAQHKRHIRRKKGKLDSIRADLEAIGKARLRGRVAKRLAKQLLDLEAEIATHRSEIRDLGRDAAAQHRAVTATLERLGKA